MPTASYSIPLSQGLVSLIDEEDRDRVAQFKWCASRSGHSNLVYAIRKESGRKLILHRIITGALPGQVVDHINGDTLDNRKANLRLVSQGENLANTGPTKKNRSGVRGVHMNRWGDWVVQIRRCGLSRYVGTFESLTDAESAFEKAYFETHGLSPRPKERAQ